MSAIADKALSPKSQDLCSHRLADRQGHGDSPAAADQLVSHLASEPQKVDLGPGPQADDNFCGRLGPERSLTRQ